MKVTVEFEITQTRNLTLQAPTPESVFDNFLGLAFEGLILTRNFDEIRKFTRHCPPLPYSERMESNAELKKFVFRIVKHSVSDCFLILGIHVWTYCTNGSLPFISIGRRDY